MGAKDVKRVMAEIAVELTGLDIDDIMVTALEGGITYWCGEAEVVGEYLGEYASDQISRGGTLILHNNEEDETYELTLEKFLNGFKLYMEQIGSLTVDCGHIDTCDVDGDVADCIIQLAVFGKVVYG